MRVIVPGAAGTLARKVCRKLLAAGHEVIGLDARPWPDAPRELEFHVADLRKRAAEDVFRRRRPQTVVHMATVSSLAAPDGERHRINLGGTRAIFDYARTHGVEHVVFAGRHTYYGASPDSPLYHLEDEPPQGLETFPELADLVAADLYAVTALWRLKETVTSVLRLCYTLGPTGHGTLASFLRGRTVPVVMGYDPLFQFMHEDDAVDAILAAVEKRPLGVFNVAGPQPLPLQALARAAGRRVLPLPEPLLALALGRGGLPKLAAGALSHLKYPIVIDSEAFRAATGWDHHFDEMETIGSFAAAFPR